MPLWHLAGTKVIILQVVLSWQKRQQRGSSLAATQVTALSGQQTQKSDAGRAVLAEETGSRQQSAWEKEKRALLLQLNSYQQQAASHANEMQRQAEQLPLQSTHHVEVHETRVSVLSLHVMYSKLSV